MRTRRRHEENRVSRREEKEEKREERELAHETSRRKGDGELSHGLLS